MDKVEKYKEIVKKLTFEVGKLGTKADDILKTQFITDDEHGHYLLYFNGWVSDMERTYGCFMHIDVTQEGKVWLQYDGTDLVLAQQLMDKGIAKEDLILGFKAPFKRKLMGFPVE